MKLFDTFSPRYLVPNGITCTSMVLGFASIRLSLTSRDEASLLLAGWLIMYTVLLDKVDGFVARRIGATSEIGVQLDSFSDLVTFGLAPAALFSQALPRIAPAVFGAQTPGARVLLVVVTAYALAATLRLAKFNVNEGDPQYFQGMPSTSSGGILACAFLAHRDLGLGERAAVGLLVWMVVHALLMVCNLPMPKLGIGKTWLVKGLQLAVVIIAYTMIPLQKFPVFLVSVATTVSLVGFVYGAASRRA